MNKRKPLLLAEKPYTIYCIYVENILQLKIQIKQQQTTCLKMFGQKFKKLNFSGTLLNVIIKKYALKTKNVTGSVFLQRFKLFLGQYTFYVITTII